MKSLEKSPPPTEVEIIDAYEWNEIIDSVVEQKAGRDHLTGLLNRRAFDSVLPRKVIEANRYNHPLVLAMLDLDHFKNINDSYGHLVGDLALQFLARMMKDKSGFRETDIFARLGGDEFAVIMPETGIENAKVAIERFHTNLSKNSLVSGENKITLKFSGGLIELESGDSAEDLVKKADGVLYFVKNNGKNGVGFQGSDGKLKVLQQKAVK